jgi:tetratricopeptide (TPR) repeat protein
MKRALAALALLLGLPLSVAACLWDRDTPASEAKGMPEVVAILTGRFERNPPLFYEIRLDRVTAQFQGHPEDLAAYDDAGVACDRLGRGDEAISWMDKKRAQLEKLDATRSEVKEQQYRYHANLGTFLVHRWVRQGADRAKIGEVEAARDEIARALEINPNAHFGREKYQLRALEWIVAPPKATGAHDLPNLLGWSFGDTYGQSTDPKEADDAVQGLAGLVALGNAWESVDIFHALNVALQRDSLGFERGPEGGRNTLAYLAWLRCMELIDAGKVSMLPDAPKGQDLKPLLPRPVFVEPDNILESAFRKLRAEAEAWHAARTAFMMSRLKEGRHPDTDPRFWDGYTERPAPSLPTQSISEAYEARRALRERLSLLTVIGVPVLAIVLAGLLAVRSKARRRKARLAKEASADLLDELR